MLPPLGLAVTCLSQLSISSAVAKRAVNSRKVAVSNLRGWCSVQKLGAHADMQPQVYRAYINRPIRLINEGSCSWSCLYMGLEATHKRICSALSSLMALGSLPSSRWPLTRRSALASLVRLRPVRSAIRPMGTWKARKGPRGGGSPSGSRLSIAFFSSTFPSNGDWSSTNPAAASLASLVHTAIFQNFRGTCTPLYGRSSSRRTGPVNTVSLASYASAWPSTWSSSPTHSSLPWLKSSTCGAALVKANVSWLAFLAVAGSPQTGSRRRTKCPRSNALFL